MQYQRAVAEFDEVAYRNSIDCIRKVFRHEGFRGMYKGLFSQMIAIGPEKAALLVVNDYLRVKFTDDRGSISRHNEVLAGAIVIYVCLNDMHICINLRNLIFKAGFCKCFLSNPIDIIKIRQQVPGPRIGLFTVLNDLGFSGLFRGIVSCWLRDTPFAAIFFYTYAHNKVLHSTIAYNN